MQFNVTVNNISVISWLSVLLVEETGVPGKKHQPVASHWQILSYNVGSSTHRHEQGSNSQLALFTQVVVRSRPQRLPTFWKDMFPIFYLTKYYYTCNDLYHANLFIFTLSLQPLPPSQNEERLFVIKRWHATHGFSNANGWNRKDIIKQKITIKYDKYNLSIHLYIKKWK